MDQLAAQEKNKYCKIWGTGEYGRYSPGYNAIQLFSNYVPMMPTESITDYGAGDCRAAVYMAQKGLQVQVVDIALTTACRTLDSIKHMFPLGAHEQCLWSMRGVHGTDYSLCADVMEHIPEEKVDTVLRAIAKKTRKTAAFTICHEPDAAGKLIGETLHLTVKPHSYWFDKLMKLFDSVVCVAVDTGTFYLCRHKDDSATPKH